MKLRARADEPKTTLALLDRFKSELVVIESHDDYTPQELAEGRS